MLQSDVDNSKEFTQLVFDLIQEEGFSVEICNPNPDFDGYNSTIFVTNDFNNSVQYFGESVIDCLKQAKKDQDE